jgi:hypothetical protein
MRFWKSSHRRIDIAFRVEKSRYRSNEKQSWQYYYMLSEKLALN